MVQMLEKKLGYLEQQNENYMQENKALRLAQIEMEERHTAEIIELKQSQLSNVKQGVGYDEEEETQMLLNLVKIKDEEIKQLKR